MRQASVLAAALATILVVSPVTADEAKTAIMYKPLQCGCCDEYAKYLEQRGFKVKVESLADRPLETVKRMATVPERLYGCHTLAVDGYTIEGLVPIAAVNKLLTEKPKIAGISLPGMPVGAPGMPGRKASPLIIYEIPQGPAAPKEFARE
ncbi:MAG: DUF411 domain-containing protein [Rhodospirillales bacterium]|nr:DUF411 domain-containing protein [Rhodospirillales bacterium]